MQAIAWSDYICPWCYLGHDRTALLRELGVTVTQLPFELHPELPATGRAVRPDGRLAAVFATVASECEELGLPFRPPTWIPNSRRALETAEVVRQQAPDAFAVLDASLMRAHWVEGGDLGDPDLLETLVTAAGADVAAVRDAVADGAGARALQASMAIARSHGVTATPAWWIDDALLIPGAQPRDAIARWVKRLAARHDPPHASDP